MLNSQVWKTRVHGVQCLGQLSPTHTTVEIRSNWGTICSCPSKKTALIEKLKLWRYLSQLKRRRRPIKFFVEFCVKVKILRRNILRTTCDLWTTL